MRKILVFILFLGINLSLVFYPKLVSAQGPTATDSMEVSPMMTETPNQDRVNTKNQVGIENSSDAPGQMAKEQNQLMEENGEGMQEKNQEMKIERNMVRIQTITRFMLQRFNAAIARLENIISRFESRIQKITLNRDTTNAASQLALAKSNVELAKSSLVEIETIVEGLSTSTDLKADALTLKEKVKEMKTYLVEAHKALQLGVTSLRNASISSTPTGSVEVLPTGEVSPTIEVVVTQAPAEEEGAIIQ